MLKSLLQFILRVLSKKILKKYKPDVVGITGSVGKTSSKEAITTVLKARFNVRKTPKNYNNEIGLPLTIIGIKKSPGRSIFGWVKVFLKALRLIAVKSKKYPEILVLEMGADKPGDIKYLIDIAPCKVGVWTSVAHAHTEAFKTLKKIILEKRNIISHLSHDSYAVLNFDNNYVMENVDKTKAEVLTFGFKDGADLQASEINFIENEETGWPKGINFKVFHKGHSVPVFLPDIIAEHLIPSALTGLVVGTVFGVNLVEGATALQNYKALAGHMRLVDGIKNTLLIDDTYNSSPEAVKSALITLSNIEVQGKGVRYAVLGDMLELGSETENSHREVGFKIAELGIDFLITVGEASKFIAQSAKEAGFEENQIAKFSNSVETGRFLQEKMKTGDVVLIKGSQGIRMEKIVKEVMAEPLKAKELLVRQDDGWKK